MGSLVHSATMSDITLDQLDWRPQARESTRMTIHDNIIHHHHQEEEETPDITMTTFGPPEPSGERCEGLQVQSSSSMFTILNTPTLKKGRNTIAVP